MQITDFITKNAPDWFAANATDAQVWDEIHRFTIAQDLRGIQRYVAAEAGLKLYREIREAKQLALDMFPPLPALGEWVAPDVQAVPTFESGVAV